VEDVLEQIVGEIEDEFDETAALPAADPGDLEIEGATPVRDLETQHGIELPDNSGFETVAGFLLWKLGHIPAAGEQVEHDGRRYTVIAVERNRITRVRVEKIPAASPSGPAET
jgi:CBS domain containing-hemolysin-like protein